MEPDLVRTITSAQSLVILLHVLPVVTVQFIITVSNIVGECPQIYLSPILSIVSELNKHVTLNFFYNNAIILLKPFHQFHFMAFSFLTKFCKILQMCLTELFFRAIT